MGPFLKRLKQICTQQSTRNFKKIAVLVMSLLLSLKMIILLSEHSDISPEKLIVSYRPVKKLQTITKNRNKYKSILIWNSPERIESSAFGFGHEPFVRNGCEVSDCVIYDNETALPLKEYDAFIMNMHVIWLTEFPYFKRRRHQRFIFMTQESPASMFLLDVKTLKNYFNWTMSYTSNSDIKFLFGRILPGPSAPKTRTETRELIEATHLPSAKNYAANKVHVVAWMASHCETPSLRETYVRQLGKFIPVHIYGGCGNFRCSRNNSHWLSDPKCYDMIETKYKFYLSFENSICDDYVTEKFFEIMNHDIVPVVYGGANYSRIAPPHSYIDALKFTPETLANYLKLLDTNDELYNEYFWWKGHYTVEAGVKQMARHGFCDLCKKLHQDEGVSKYYPQLVTEWHPKNKCKYFDSWETQS
jgi:alpha-1,3-fucosyltransferase